MRYLSWHRDNGLEADRVFQFIIDNLADSIKTWDYFINWGKVKAKLEGLKYEISLLNSLIGAEDFPSDYLTLVRRYPEVIKAIPALLAVREHDIKVITGIQGGRFHNKRYMFAEWEISPEDSLEFVMESGLSELFLPGQVSSLMDYVRGVEVGLDTHGRKNRGGRNMENAVEKILLRIQDDRPELEVMSQATADTIKGRWGIEINTDRANRSLDFAVFNRITGKLFLIESNFFNAGGSKLKSVCGEFQTMHQLLSDQKVDFIWITDGRGWRTTQRQFQEAFDALDYVLNFKLVEMGLLEHIFTLE